MRTFNIHEAKTHFSKLLDRVAAGEEIIIARAGEPIARLTAYDPPDRVGGDWEGLVWIGDDFDAPLPDDMARSFGLIDE